MTLDELREIGEHVRQSFNADFQLALDYDRPTVEWVAGYIERNRNVFSPEKRYSWALAFGYILGEAVVRVFGGRWVRHSEFADEWVIELPHALGHANPIGKAYKHLEDPMDSVASFFRFIGLAIQNGGFENILCQPTADAYIPEEAPQASLAAPASNDGP